MIMTVRNPCRCCEANKQGKLVPRSGRRLTCLTMVSKYARKRQPRKVSDV